MTDKLKDWSTTAANNNSTAPNGWPEGMAPSEVNNTARQGMASMREWYEDAQWIRLDHSIVSSTASTVVVSGDVTGFYVANRGIRLDQDNAKIGYVSSSSYSAPNTTINISGLTISSPTIIEGSIIRSSAAVPEDLKGVNNRIYAPGFISGLKATSDADADHDVQIAIGSCRSDGDSANIDLSSVITKQIDAVWAEGDDAGGLASTVTLSGPEWIYVFLISKTDGTVDAGFDDNASATNLLSDASAYSYYRHIASVYIDPSNNIEAILNNSEIGLGKCQIIIETSTTFPKPPLVIASLAVYSISGAKGISPSAAACLVCTAAVCIN